MKSQSWPDFGRRLFARCLWLFAGAMACLVVGFYGETQHGGGALRVLGHGGFLGFAIAIPLYVWHRSRKARCPRCGAWLHSDPKRNPEAALKFVCLACDVAWDTQGVVAW
jgi:hypothetical protein